MTRRGPIALSGELDKLAQRLNLKSGGSLTQIKIGEVWRSIAGPAVLGHTGKAYLRSHELVVETDSPAWANELQAFSEQYRKEINKQTERNLVSNVRFTVSREVSRQKAQERVSEETKDLAPAAHRLALSEVEIAQIKDSASGIPDADLRDAVIRATVADLEWKKGRRAALASQKPPEGL